MKTTWRSRRLTRMRHFTPSRDDAILAPVERRTGFTLSRKLLAGKRKLLRGEIVCGLRVPGPADGSVEPPAPMAQADAGHAYVRRAVCSASTSGSSQRGGRLASPLQASKVTMVSSARGVLEICGPRCPVQQSFQLPESAACGCIRAVDCSEGNPGWIPFRRSPVGPTSRDRQRLRKAPCGPEGAGRPSP